MFGIVLLMGFLVVYLAILVFYVKNRLRLIRQSGEEEQASPFSFRSCFGFFSPLRERCIWGNALFLAIVVGSVLNLNGYLAVEKEFSAPTLLRYGSECTLQIVTFYLIPFCVSSASGFLSQLGGKTFFSLMMRVFSCRD